MGATERGRIFISQEPCCSPRISLLEPNRSLGTGIERIYDKAKDYRLREPKLELRGNGFSITLYRRRPEFDEAGVLPPSHYLKSPDLREKQAINRQLSGDLREKQTKELQAIGNVLIKYIGTEEQAEEWNKEYNAFESIGVDLFENIDLSISTSVYEGGVVSSVDIY